MTQVAITSPRNPRVAAAHALRDRQARDAAGLTLVDGARETLRALEAGVTVVTVFACPTRLHSDDARRLLAALAEPGHGERVDIGPAALDRLAYGDRRDGIVAVVRPPRRTLADLVLPAAPLVVVLEGVEKPGNVGAILRTADAAGVDALIVADPATDLYNPNTIRASLGTIFTVPVVTAAAREVLAWIQARRLTAVVARVDAEQAYTDVDYRPGVALVLGSEASGLTEAWRGPRVTAVRLPMRGSADSLSVSAAAAVLFYEARRQRDQMPVLHSRPSRR
ncbi:MAG: TrmH family RNA methyltransferase [Candidatus Limnocylindrales bacterium]